MLEQVDKCLKSLTLAVIDDFSLTGIKSEGIGILIDVVDDGTSTGEMGFTYSNSEITWGLESIESFQATIELWKNMGKTWDSIFIIINLKTMETESFFFTKKQTKPWRKKRNDYIGAKNKFMELYKQISQPSEISEIKNTKN